MCRHLNATLLLLWFLIGCGGGGTGPSDPGGASGDQTPPTAPTDLTASPVSAGEIGLATSPDGVTWTKSASNPVIAAKGLVSAYAPGAVVKTANQFVLYYSADGNIGRATSSDGVAWSDRGTVFAPESVRYARPSVVLDGATWRMWITRIEGVGSGIANPSAVYPITVGYADSTDGVTWSTYGNPVLTAGAEGAWDRPCVGGPAVVKDGAAFRMWYAGGRGNLPGQLWDANPFVEGAIGYAVAP